MHKYSLLERTKFQQNTNVTQAGIVTFS